MLFQLVQDEQPRIARLEDTKESCLEYWEHYKKLTPWEGVMVGYWICAADKRFIDDYLEEGAILYPVTTVARKSVGNGGGKMISIDPATFMYPGRFFYTRSDMKIEPDCENGDVSKRIEELALGVKLFSKGLMQVETEIIHVPTVDGEYYAVTFFLDEHGEYENNAGFEPASEGKYVLPLTYIEDQMTYVGTLGRDPVLLDYDSMTFDWETEEYKWL